MEHAVEQRLIAQQAAEYWHDLGLKCLELFTGRLLNSRATGVKVQSRQEDCLLCESGPYQR